MKISKQELIELYSKLEKAFGKKQDPARAEIFYEKVKDLSFDTVKEAVERAIENEERFPTIAKIFSYIKQNINKTGITQNDFIQCEKCKNTGWIDYEVDGYKFSCFCDCDLGKIRHQETNESIQKSENISPGDKIKIALWHDKIIEQTKQYLKKYALGYEPKENEEVLEDAIPF